ncbi:helix-turn-helix transcriptional regulator [Citricoccus sp. I39-566]|uniref:helix-turn-helix domain-containing protein n=1 Tax=Citricoccus sp. I39-566 TaxID=3073268 RepID=UPI00286D142F|nr:helix-turn-helix transcriptional regulator [Citricoccus sp. I39-566]WMY77695.1 helix-turn-helix transcriptional regulator [Citricoccus sp. I39-566]
MVNKVQQRQLMGAYIRQQRRIADLSMRQMSAMVGISNPYLSQIERGLRAPSEAVAAGIATALGVGVDELYEQDSGDPGSGVPGPTEAGGPGPEAADPEPADPQAADVLAAIHEAQELTPEQRTSLAEIYRSFVRSNRSD